MAQASYFHGQRPASGWSAAGRREGVLGRIGRWIAEWRKLRRRMRSEAELKYKLHGYDEHLLRDMGLMRCGGRLSRAEPGSTWLASYRDDMFGRWMDPINPDWNPWR
jgi:hypothetical protein